jgi:aminoglycoside phosphotransferase (APT) family kinase protein
LTAESFLAAQGVAATCWEKVKEKITTEGYKVNWNADLVGIIEASLARVSWPDYLTHSKKIPWTLVHGDFHPANMMLRKDSHELVLLDWEMVGLGSGPQDLGQ